MRTEQLPFAVGEPREGPLAWGQDAILRELTWLAEESFTYNETVLVDVAPGTTLVQVFDVIRSMTEAYESLRTTVIPTAKPDEPRQRVHANGHVAVRVIDGTSATAGNPDARHNFDLTTEYPILWTVYCHDGEPVEVLAVLSHFTIDGGALAVFREQLTNRLPPTAPTLTEERGWHPLDQAAWESSDGGPDSDGAVQRWIRLVTEAPRHMFNVRYPSAGDMDFQCHEMRSVAAAVALERISQRMKVSTSAVLIALTAVTVARLSGNRRAIFKVVVGNRREEHLKAYISPLVQDGVISIDTDGDFDTVIRRAWPASILAYSRSRYRPSDLQVAALAYEAEQGHDGDPRVALNDARFSEEFSELPDPVDRAGLWELCDETVISHVFSQERVDVKLFIEISQSTDCLQVTLLTDGTYVPSGMIPQILRNMETLLIRESLQEAPDDPPFAMLPRDHDWALVEGNWVQPAHLCALLASLPGVDRAELVDPAPDRSADGLTCRLFVNAEFNLEGAALRREAVEVLRGHEDIVIPSRFDIQPSAGECQ